MAAAFALGAADQRDVARRARHPQRAAGAVALDDLAARTHPHPFAACVADAVLGLEDFGVPDDVFLQQLLHARQVVGMDRLRPPVVGAQFLATALSEQLVRAEAIEAVVADVPVPELVAGTPQREVQPFLALADPTRRAILARLALGEASVAELAAPFAISQPAIWQIAVASAMLGAFRNDARTRSEFLDLIKPRKI